MTDKAFIIGINAYPGNELLGCVNDAQDVAEFLVAHYGFKANAIRLLVDKRATTAAILTRLTWLTKGAKPGDRLLFWYSGHGAQVADRNGDEIDSLDEVICPVEFNWSPEHLINDDTFASIFGAIPSGAHFNWVSDSCHSGSLTRAIPVLQGPQTYFIPDSTIPVRSRAMPTPVDVKWHTHAAAAAKAPTKRLGQSTMNVGFVSGCKDSQTSADATFNGRPNGALTFYLLKALQEAATKTPRPRLSNVVADVRKALSHAGYSQQPQCEGLLSGSPFLGG